MSPTGRSPQFTTLETARELESKCVPQLSLGSLQRPRRSSIGQFFFYSPRSLCENRLTRPSSLLGEYRPGVTRSQVLTAHNVYRFVSLCQDRFIFSQYAGNAHGYNIRYASRQNLYKSKVRTIYNSGKQTITYTATITREILFNL